MREAIKRRCTGAVGHYGVARKRDRHSYRCENPRISMLEGQSHPREYAQHEKPKYLAADHCEVIAGCGKESFRRTTHEIADSRLPSHTDVLGRVTHLGTETGTLREFR